jgi:hypothetical protein
LNIIKSYSALPYPNYVDMMQKFATFLKTIYPSRYRARQVTIYEYVHPESDLSVIASEEVSDTQTPEK